MATIESILEDEYGVGPMVAPPTTILWAADQLGRTEGYGPAREALDKLNAKRQRRGKTMAFPEYQTPLWLAGWKPEMRDA